jgi:hypothetical protein
MPPPSNEELGALMQHFYLLLSADTDADTDTSSDGSGKRSSRNLSELIQAINCLEDSILYADVTSEQLADPSFAPEAVALEIVQDCQRKGAAAIRGHYAAAVRGLIFACRKQLRSKTSIVSGGGAGGGGGEHSQRHLNAMVELLGE